MRLCGRQSGGFILVHAASWMSQQFLFLVDAALWMSTCFIYVDVGGASPA
jgi:hypothetical protein